MKQAAICAGLVAICVTVVAAGSREAAVSLVITQGVPKPQPKVDSAQATRAARHDALIAADEATWAARSAMRLEPKTALKGIPMTTAERAATNWTADEFGDRSAMLNRDDRQAYRAAGELSTIMADVAALRLEQRAALRAALTPVNRVQFDANIAKLVAKRL